MSEIATRELMVRLRNSAGRAEAAQALAAHLGVHNLLLFVRDPALGTLIPAPGLPQTLHGGRTWRAFLKSCSAPGRYSGEVELPTGTHGPAEAIVVDGTALVLLGAKPTPAELQVVENLLPLLAATLGAEQDAVMARAEGAAAKEAADRSQALATALEAARAETSKLNAELRNEHRRKDEFLAMLGHELRNPLAPLVTAIELMRRHTLSADAFGKLVGVMGRQTDQLSRLVEDLLDVSRVSQGRIELKREPILLGDALADALDESRPIIEAQRHELEIVPADEPLTVDADRVRLTQVFGNLLNNAAKYTERGGRLILTVRREGEEAVVRLQDSGVGISQEMLPHIFDLFAQAPVSLDRSRGGLGIGLTLVRTLVELHGGRVTATSEGIGRGSTFSVRLPLVPAAARSAPPRVESRNHGIAEVPLRVLVVDDNEDAAEAIAVLLRLMGHEADVAHDGSTALQLESVRDADLVLLDIGLPGMDGYEVARRMRPIAKDGARFVALTGYGTEEGKRRSREAGFDEHIVKPVTAGTLESLVARAAKGRARAPVSSIE